jgi:hypothetical protein
VRDGALNAEEAARAELPTLPPPPPAAAGSVPPESSDAASAPASSDDELAIFARGELPDDLVALREKRTKRNRP